MKIFLPNIISRATVIFVSVASACFMAAQEAHSATLYTDTNSTTGWTTDRWSSSTNGPFTSAWTANSDVIFLSGGRYNFSAPSNTFQIGNVTVESNAAVKFTSIGSTLGTGGNVRTLTVETNAVLDFASQAFSTAAGTGFIKEGSGVLASGNGNGYQGGFTLNGGTMVVRGINAMGSGATNILTLSNGTIAADTNREITVGKYGGGIFIKGNIQMGALSNNYATNAQYLINNNASISFADDVSLTGAMRTLTIGGNGTYTFGGVISNGGMTVDLASGATGRILLSGNNTYSNGTVISSGTLQLGNNTTSGSVLGNITNNGTLIINRSDTFTMTNAISGSGRLIQSGTGTTTLTADNTYTGSTIISNSTLQVGNGGTNGAIAGTGINIAAGGSLVINRSDNVTLGQTITNNATGSFVQLGTGTTTLTTGSGSIFKGGILVSNGTLQLGDGTQSYSLSDGGITNNSTLIWNRSGNGNVSNVITGSGTFIKLGSGNLYILSNNTYTGSTIISNGLLSLGNTGTSGSVAGAINIADSGATLRVTRDDAFTMTNQISGTGKFLQSGTGTTTLTTNNTFSGSTTISAGGLALNASSGSALGSTASVTVSASATLLLSKSEQVNNSATVTLSGGTIQRASGVSETFGNLNLTAGSFLDYGTGSAGTLTFGTYTPSSLLTVGNFFAGNKLVFGNELTPEQLSTKFDFDHAFTTDWNGSTFTITAIPEPSAYAAIVSLIGLMLWRRAKRGFAVTSDA